MDASQRVSAAGTSSNKTHTASIHYWGLNGLLVDLFTLKDGIGLTDVSPAGKANVNVTIDLAHKNSRERVALKYKKGHRCNSVHIIE